MLFELGVLVLLELVVVLLLLALLLLDKVQLPGCIVRRGVSPQAMSSYHSLPSLSLPPFAPGGGVHAPKNAFFNGRQIGMHINWSGGPAEAAPHPPGGET